MDFQTTAGKLAKEALLKEVMATPKPGLVDQRDNGAHRDMDVHTFEVSARALEPYFGQMGWKGYVWRQSPESLFLRIRSMGIQAEREMFRQTNGVNTHKGAVFTIGILAASAGQIYAREGKADTDEIFVYARKMCETVLEAEIQEMLYKSPATHGEWLLCTSGERGIRGEAQKGFPVLREVAVPILKKCLEEGIEEEKAYLQTLLAVIETLTDTNVLSRSSAEGLRWMQQRASGILKAGGALSREGLQEIRVWNQECIRRNISPGGAADMLAAAIFLVSLQKLQEGEKKV